MSIKRSFIREILEAIDEHTISFAGGLPSANLFPVEDLKEATLKIIDNPKVYQYHKDIQNKAFLQQKIIF